ncbi:MAG: cadherin domain-containing protein, partial [Microvirga sp.]
APSLLLLSAAAVAENAVSGTLVGQLSAQDPDPNDTLTYTLLDDAGGRFRIQGDRVVVGDGAAIDYERASGHTIKVLVTDKAGGSATAVFRIAVTDVAERVTLVGGAGIDTLLGGSLGDRLTGLGGADVLAGLGGDDVLSGGAGRDGLTGGPGHDTFVFDTRLARTNKAHKKAELDRIADFSVAEDTIQLSKAVFSKIGKAGILKTGMLAKGAFHLGAGAHDASDRVIYDRKSGALYYDQDGTGRHEAIQIAILSKNLKMSHANIFIL